VDIGTLVAGDEIRNRTKDPKSAKAETLNAPYFEGIVEGGDKCRSSPLVKFIFNQRKKGWNYAWQASKHTAKARHAFFAYLFVQPNMKDDVYKCVGVYVSPTFILYCRKRKGDTFPGRRGMFTGDVDDFDEEEEEEEEDEAEREPTPRRRAASKKKRMADAASRLSDSDEHFPASRKKVLHLEPIVSPAKLLPGPPSSSSFVNFTGSLTPMTAMFVTSFGRDPTDEEPTPSGTRTSATGTPSSWSDDNSDEIDFEAANQLDQVVVSRVAAVLNRLHEVLTASGTAETLGMPQFALDWFINDLEEFADLGDDALPGGNFAFSTTAAASSSSTTPRPMPEGFVTPKELEPLDWSAAMQEKDILTELAEYLLEESSLTASIRQIIARAEDGKLSSESRLRSFIKVFNNELSNFLARRGYSEKDLDQALEAAVAKGVTKPEDPSKILGSLNEHVKHVVESQQRLDNVRTNPPKTWMRAITVRPEIDLSGHWRLDDTLLRAFDECRAKRGVPFMMRKLLGYMETHIVISHSAERIVIGLKSKLFASAEVAYELDGVERIWDVAPPVPWPTKLCETYRAWVDNDTLRYCHTYDGVCRTDRFVRKNASGDRLEMDVYYQEMDSNGVWQTALFRRGYALKITAVNY